jgi:hypothetical protein
MSTERSVAEIIRARIERQDGFDWRPSPEDPNFPAWVVEEIRRGRGGHYYPHPPYTDLGRELLTALCLLRTWTRLTP